MATQNTPFPTSDTPPSTSGTATTGSSSYGGSTGSSGYGGASASGGYGGATPGNLGGGNGGPTAASTDPTMSRVVQGAHDVVDRLAEKAAPVVDKLKSRMSGAGESLRGNADQLSQMQEEWIATARTCVRDHPLASVAVAVAAGMVLSKLMSSSR
jgi:ElaB/YqjD/DUF883 family membrane-anchored ribosome-binding protein